MSRCLSRVLISLSVAAVAGTVVTMLAACNTVKGVGTDIHNVGSAGQNAISGNRSGGSSSSTSNSPSEPD